MGDLQDYPKPNYEFWDERIKEDEGLVSLWNATWLWEDREPPPGKPWSGDQLPPWIRLTWDRLQKLPCVNLADFERKGIEHGCGWIGGPITPNQYQCMQVWHLHIGTEKDLIRYSVRTLRQFAEETGKRPPFLYEEERVARPTTRNASAAVSKKEEPSVLRILAAVLIKGWGPDIVENLKDEKSTMFGAVHQYVSSRFSISEGTLRKYVKRLPDI